MKNMKELKTEENMMGKIRTGRTDVERYIFFITPRVRTAKATIEDIQERIDKNKNNTKKVIINGLRLREVKKIKVLDIKMIDPEKNKMKLDILVQKRKKERRRERIIERDNRIEQQRRKQERRMER